MEECDVVGVAELCRGRPRKLAEAYRKHGSPKGMLERLPRAEISRERKRADELGCADRPLCTPRTRAGSCWVGLHGEILEAPQRSFASASRTSYSQIGWRVPYGSSSRIVA